MAQALAAVAGLSLAGCSPAPGPPWPDRSFMARANARVDAGDAMVWCLIRKRIIPPGEVLTPQERASAAGTKARREPLVQNDRLHDDALFAAWVNDHSGDVYGGKSLERWMTGAWQLPWPRAMCGPKPSGFPTAPVYPQATPFRPAAAGPRTAATRR